MFHICIKILVDLQCYTSTTCYKQTGKLPAGAVQQLILLIQEASENLQTLTLREDLAKLQWVS